MLVGVYAVLLIYPMTMFVVEGLRSEFIAILILLSLVAFALNKFQLDIFTLDREETLVLLPFLLVFLVALASYAWFGFLDEAKTRMDRYSYFLLVFPIYSLFRYTRPKMEVIWIGVVVGCYIAFGRAVLEEMDLVEEIVRGVSRIDPNRANGVMNPIRFGCLSLIMGFIALIGTLNFRDSYPGLRIIGLFGFFSGLCASILSESRGAWIAVPLLLVISIWSYFREQKKSVRYLAIIGAVLTVLIITFTPMTGVKARIDIAVSNVSDYFESNKQNTSVGIRLYMVETAYQAFSENKVFGIGLGRYREYAKSYYLKEKPGINSKITWWKNPHNEYLLHASTRGLIGIAALLILFFSGIYFFVKQRKEAIGSYSFSAISGLVLYVGYMHFGLTIALFEHRNFLVFFIIYSILFIACRPVTENTQRSEL